MNRSWVALLLVASAGALAAPERIPQFRHAAEIVLEGEGAIYAIELPEAFYRGVARSDLGDLRVLNGADEVVPHALLHAAASEHQPTAPFAMPLFPVYGPPGGVGSNVDLRVERRRDGTLSALVFSGPRGTLHRQLLGYVIDASAGTRALRELRFEWPAGPEGTSLDVRVEAGDDLQSWRGVGSGRLIVLRQGELLLERRAVEFPPTRAKYFRVTWRSAPEDFKFTGATGLQVDDITEVARAWFRSMGAPGAQPGEFVFELPPALPVDRLRFQLPQENAIAGASILLQDRPGSPARVLATTVLYRMQHQGQALVSPDLVVSPATARRWILRVDTRGGGLGEGNPTMQAGYLPHRLVIVARGKGPFRAQFGDAEAQSTGLTVQALVPGYAPDKPLPALPARFGEVTTREPSVASAPEVLRAYFQRMDAKKLWLWGALLLAVVLIVGMGWHLMRQLPREEMRPGSKAPHESP